MAQFLFEDNTPVSNWFSDTAHYGMRIAGRRDLSSRNIGVLLFVLVLKQYTLKTDLLFVNF